MKSLFFLFAFISINCYSQTPDFQWAVGGGGNSWDLTRCVTTDSERNVFITGYFQSTTITFGTTVLTNKDQSGLTMDLYIVKYDTSGNVIWAKSYGGKDDDYALSISISKSGTFIVSGGFSSPKISFDTITLVNKTNETYFIVKFDSSANPLWAEGGYNSISVVLSTVFDNVGNYFLNGMFSDSITFGNITLNDPELAGFIVKYDSLGSVQWARKVRNIETENYQVTTDLSGNLILSGSYYGDTLSFDSINLINTGERDIFVAKFDPYGNALWAKSAGGPSFDWGYGVATDLLGNVVIAGSFYGPDIAFDTIYLNGNGDIFLAKYDQSGNVLWAKTVYGNASDEATGIATDSSGNIFITGETSSQIIAFDTIYFFRTGYNNDIFIAECNSSGNFIWAKIVKGENCAIGSWSICTDSSGDPIIAGFYHSPTISFGDYTLVNDGVCDAFLTKVHIEPIPAEVPEFQFNNIIYPNPGKGRFTVKSSQLINKIEISTFLGQTISMSYPNNKEMSFQIDKPGMYLISLTIGKQKITKKIIVTQ